MEYHAGVLSLSFIHSVRIYSYVISAVVETHVHGNPRKIPVIRHFFTLFICCLHLQGYLSFSATHQVIFRTLELFSAVSSVLLLLQIFHFCASRISPKKFKQNKISFIWLQMTNKRLSNLQTISPSDYVLLCGHSTGRFQKVSTVLL